MNDIIISSSIETVTISSIVPILPLRNHPRNPKIHFPFCDASRSWTTYNKCFCKTNVYNLNDGEKQERNKNFYLFKVSIEFDFFEHPVVRQSNRVFFHRFVINILANVKNCYPQVVFWIRLLFFCVNLPFDVASKNFDEDQELISDQAVGHSINREANSPSLEGHDIEVHIACEGATSSLKTRGFLSPGGRLW